MKIKSFVAVLLAAFLILGLAGCQFGTKPSPSPDVSSEPPETPARPSESPSAAPPETPSDEPSPEPSAAPSEPAPSETPSAGTIDIAVYYMKDNGKEAYLVREVHTVPKTKAVAQAALNELISGTPVTEGAFKVLPADTKILGIKIENGLATVDFSKEVLYANVGAAGEILGIDSIVNTLTEFPTIKKVSFTVEGSAENGMDWWGHMGLYQQPFSRNLSMVWEPAIWVNAPAAGEKVGAKFTLRGNARVFEATVCWRLRDDTGAVLAEGFTTAASGAPERGDFETTVTFKPSPAGKGQLEVFEVSMKDGSDMNKVIIPVTW